MQVHLKVACICNNGGESACLFHSVQPSAQVQFIYKLGNLVRETLYWLFLSMTALEEATELRTITWCTLFVISYLS